MKAINLKMEDQYHDDLEVIREHFSLVSGVKISKAQALKRLLHETASAVRTKGKLWSWEGGNADK